MILCNKAQCTICGDVIESRHRHDFVTCKCGALSVDGGLDYLKRSGDPRHYLELSENQENCNYPEPDIAAELSKVDLKDYKTKVPVTDFQWKAIGHEQGVFGVFKFALKKYGNVNSWRNRTPESMDRYISALLRHFFKMKNGELIDDESGLLHAAHMAWCALTILEFQIEDKLNGK